MLEKGPAIRIGPPLAKSRWRGYVFAVMAISLKEAFKAFGFTLSLPERLVRSAAVAIGGTSKLLTDTLIPEPLRKTTAYTAMVGNSQRFFIEKVAEVQGAYEASADGAGSLPENYIPRAVAGNVINAAGLFAVHLSPLWVFAFVSDIAHGSKAYLNKLVAELKENGVIDKDAHIKEVDELLEALGKAGKDTALVFDLPPVDVASLTKLRDDLTRGYSGVFKEATDLLPRMDNLWEKMQSLASRDGVAMESVVGLMTLDLEATAGKAVGAAFAVGNATADVLSETIFQSYGETIYRIQERGAVTCLEEAGKPFFDAITAHLSSNKQSWTEWALDKIMSPFVGEDAPPVAPVPPVPGPESSAPPAGMLEACSPPSNPPKS